MVRKATTIAVVAGISALSGCSSLEQFRTSLAQGFQSSPTRQASAVRPAASRPVGGEVQVAGVRPESGKPRPLTSRAEASRVAEVESPKVRPAARAEAPRAVRSASVAPKRERPAAVAAPRVVAQTSEPRQASRVQILGALMRTWNKIVPEEIDSEALFGIPPKDLVAPSSRADAGSPASAPVRG